jgi:hypothetical protein
MVNDLVAAGVVVILGLIIIGLIAFIGGAANENRENKRRSDAERLNMLVMAAEQLYGPGKGEAKRRYVREKAKQHGIKADREDLEAAVYKLNRAA